MTPPLATALVDRRVGPVLDFVLPEALRATAPPEVRGRGRDDVRLLVSWRATGDLRHDRFGGLVDVLWPGDLVVVNTSATLPAAIDGWLPDGTSVELHFSTRLPAGLHVVELRHPDGASSTPWLDAPAGITVALPEGGVVETLVPAGPVAAGPVRLWVAAARLPSPLEPYLAAHGRPIRYDYVPRDWGIDAYQTVFATVPGSAEMPSAARPFTASLVTSLIARGVAVAPLVLHAGVSSGEVHEPPYPEFYRVPAATARQVELARSNGGRVVAVGTTVVRALETVTDDNGQVHPGEGWTETVVTPATGARSVDGLLTGWHEPMASHLAMLEAVAGLELLSASYAAALEQGYRWHEFGDSHLILP
jgi:S-adenosylmethionine:tRNA ribosyltransferase-isomerase